MNVYLAGLLLYSVALMAIGVYFSRRVKNAQSAGGLPAYRAYNKA